jgi:hypothetical protein
MAIQPPVVCLLLGRWPSRFRLGNPGPERTSPLCAIWHLEANGETASVDCYGRRINFPVRAGEAVQFALSHSRFAVRELAGDLDDAGKLAVIRRLIQEGLVMVFTT